MNKLLMTSFLMLVTSTALAENPINTQTKSWKSIPITVDTTANTYTLKNGYLLPEGNYYYTYSGHRCLNENTQIAGVNPVVLKAQNNGPMIYCYPDK